MTKSAINHRLLCGVLAGTLLWTPVIATSAVAADQTNSGDGDFGDALVAGLKCIGHLLTLTACGRLDEAVVPSAPPPPPPPPPPTKTFIVFFAFDSSDLDAQSLSVITQAVETAKQLGFAKVLVTGHTDTVGTDSYNMALSLRRALSVKTEMIRDGMDGSSVAIEGKGFHDPLVLTGPGVREPQNRRAVIDLGASAP